MVKKIGKSTSVVNPNGKSKLMMTLKCHLSGWVIKLFDTTTVQKNGCLENRPLLGQQFLASLNVDFSLLLCHFTTGCTRRRSFCHVNLALFSRWLFIHSVASSLKCKLYYSRFFPAFSVVIFAFGALRHKWQMARELFKTRIRNKCLKGICQRAVYDTI